HICSSAHFLLICTFTHLHIRVFAHYFCNPQMDHNTASQQNLAISLINDTSRHLFIIWNVGPVKTTLLRELKKECPKKMITAAPTGVAAINAGGVTLHSLFKLPPELILPVPGTSPIYKTIRTVLAEYTLSGEKEKLLRELEVLV